MKYPLLDRVNQDGVPVHGGEINVNEHLTRDDVVKNYETKETGSSKGGMSEIESFRNDRMKHLEHCATSVRNSAKVRNPNPVIPMSYLPTQSDNYPVPQGVKKEVYAKPLLEDVQEELENLLQRSFKDKSKRAGLRKSANCFGSQQR